MAERGPSARYTNTEKPLLEKGMGAFRFHLWREVRESALVSRTIFPPTSFITDDKGLMAPLGARCIATRLGGAGKLLCCRSNL
jgi:hypothetical protein